MLITTPLVLSAWKKKLAQHPDKEYVEYILSGIEHGFRIGVDDCRVFTSAKTNMQSSRENPHVIEEYVKKEVEKGNILGPFTPEVAPKVHINIPK